MSFSDLVQHPTVLIYLSSRSKLDLENAVRDMEEVIGPYAYKDPFAFTDFSPFVMEKDKCKRREMYKAKAQGVAHQLTKAALLEVQVNNPDVFIAVYEHHASAEAHEVGNVMTGIWQWQLAFADLDVMMRVDQQATGKSDA